MPPLTQDAFVTAVIAHLKGLTVKGHETGQRLDAYMEGIIWEPIVKLTVEQSWEQILTEASLEGAVEKVAAHCASMLALCMTAHFVTVPTIRGHFIESFTALHQQALRSERAIAQAQRGVPVINPFSKFVH